MSPTGYAVQQAAQDTVEGVFRHSYELVVIVGLSLAAFAVTTHYVPATSRTLLEHNIFGIDINKTTAREREIFAQRRRKGGAGDKEVLRHAIPESLGIVAGAVYLSVVLGLMVTLHIDVSALSGPLMTITVMLLLGFVDDVLDVRWRYKILFSALGTLPLVLVYDGSLSVVIPPTLTRYLASMHTRILSGYHGFASTEWSLLWLADRHYIEPSAASSYWLLNIGKVYLVYLALLCIFCTNSINILAGVNGLEVGQSIIIGVASIVYNVVQLRLENDEASELSLAATSHHQIRALVLLGPFVAVSAALWRFNRYPARIFVGDSYTYFAGTVLAVAAVAGVYSKTLLLFFVPQLINFLVSLPQLFNIVLCPRHRVPHWKPTQNVLTNSHNYTLLNLVLWLFGDMSEKMLSWTVLCAHIITCLFGFIVRYLIASWMYDHVH